MRAALEEASVPRPVFIKSVAGSTHRVRNTAVFMSASPDGVPPALLHNLKHNQVLHERVLILTVPVEDVPYADPGARLEVHDAGHGFYRVVLHYGFMEDVDVPRELASLDCIGGPFDMITASFFLGLQKLLASPDNPGMARSEEHTSELQSLMRISYAVF